MSDEGYPEEPGYKQEGPSAEAAAKVAGSAKALRTAVFSTLLRCGHGMTADQIADNLRRSVLSVRPRVSELRRLGMIRASGERGKNQSGMTATVWVVAKPLPNEVPK